MRGRLLRACVAASVVAVVTLVPSSAHATPATPVVLGALPHADVSDGRGGGFLRVTFSPDGDGRGDRVLIRAREAPGDRLRLDVRRLSSAVHIDAGVQDVGSPVATLTWNGLDADGERQPSGSYVIRACSALTGECAATRVLAHLRALTVFTPRVTAVSVGETIPVVIATDRVGPYTLDLVPASAPRGPGAGESMVARPGRLGFRIPPVAGGLELLRVRSGEEVTYFPIVVHEAELPLGLPPPSTALVVYPYLTWRAYDRSDLDRDGRIDSWYAHPRQPVVPLTGPFESLRREPGLASREAGAGSGRAFAVWLHEHDLTAQHVTDIELGRMPAAVLRRYATIVFAGHTEYYERATYDRLLVYRNRGGRLYFLQANSFYGEVAVGRSSITRLSYRFRTPARSDFRLAANGYRSCCWPRSTAPRYHLAPGVRERLPWLFEGTDLKANDAFGLPLTEADAVDPQLSPPGTVTIASAVVPRFANPGEVEAFGWLGTQPFAHEPAPIRPRRVDIAYAATGRGEVFSWGNNGFMESLLLSSLPEAERAALSRVALNVWMRFTR